jgi:putative transposon-encoded protein
MKIINIEPKNEIKVKNIDGFLKGKVTWYGTGAKVDCPKRYLGQDVYLVILKKKDGKSNRRKPKIKK